MHVHSNQVYSNHFAKLHVILNNHVGLHKNTWGDKIGQGGHYCPGKFVRGDNIARANLSGGTDFKGDKFACDTGT